MYEEGVEFSSTFARLRNLYIKSLDFDILNVNFAGSLAQHFGVSNIFAIREFGIGRDGKRQKKKKQARKVHAAFELTRRIYICESRFFVSNRKILKRWDISKGSLGKFHRSGAKPSVVNF